MLRQEQEEEEEELQEADILWPDAVRDLELAKMYYSHGGGDDDDDDGEYSGEHRTTKLHNGQKASSPIDIPGKSSRATGAKAQTLAGFSKFSASRAGAGGSSLMIGSHVFMPPHVIVDRRAKRDKAILMVVDVPKGRRAIVMLE